MLFSASTCQRVYSYHKNNTAAETTTTTTSTVTSGEADRRVTSLTLA
jgi:hypothetical protein